MHTGTAETIEARSAEFSLKIQLRSVGRFTVEFALLFSRHIQNPIFSIMAKAGLGPLRTLPIDVRLLVFRRSSRRKIFSLYRTEKLSDCNFTQFMFNDHHRYVV